VTNVRIYFVSPNETVYVVSAEDKGCVRLIELEKKSFFGYSFSADFLFNKRLQATAAISLLRP